MQSLTSHDLRLNGSFLIQSTKYEGRTLIPPLESVDSLWPGEGGSLSWGTPSHPPARTSPLQPFPGFRRSTSSPVADPHWCDWYALTEQVPLNLNTYLNLLTETQQCQLRGRGQQRPAPGSDLCRFDSPVLRRTPTSPQLGSTDGSSKSSGSVSGCSNPLAMRKPRARSVLGNRFTSRQNFLE